MNMKKYLRKLLPLAIGGMILAGGMGTAFASSTAGDIESIELPSFTEFMADDSADINKADLTKLESLYKELVKLEKAEKFDAADKKWDEFYTILDKYYDSEDVEFDDEDFEDEDYEMEVETPETFKEFIKDFEDVKISADDMKASEKLYNELLALEKAEKYDEADKKWDALFDILDKYFPEEDCTDGDCADCEA